MVRRAGAEVLDTGGAGACHARAVAAPRVVLARLAGLEAVRAGAGDAEVAAAGGRTLAGRPGREAGLADTLGAAARAALAIISADLALGSAQIARAGEAGVRIGDIGLVAAIEVGLAGLADQAAALAMALEAPQAIAAVAVGLAGDRGAPAIVALTGDAGVAAAARLRGRASVSPLGADRASSRDAGIAAAFVAVLTAFSVASASTARVLLDVAPTLATIAVLGAVSVDRATRAMPRLAHPAHAIFGAETFAADRGLSAHSAVAAIASTALPVQFTGGAGAATLRADPREAAVEWLAAHAAGLALDRAGRPPCHGGCGLGRGAHRRCARRGPVPGTRRPTSSEHQAEDERSSVPAHEAS